MVDVGGSENDWKIYESMKTIELCNKLFLNFNTFLSHNTDLKKNFKRPIENFNNEKFLFNDNGIYKIGNNVCPHQGSIIISEKTENLTCQYHGWAWDDSGNPVSNGSSITCNKSKIQLKKLFETNSLIFTQDIDLSMINIDLSNMRLIESRIDKVNSNYTNIIDVFLDVDHIPIVHKSVYNQIGIPDAADVDWKFYDWGNIQSVKRTKNNSNNFQKTLLGTVEESLAAIWITVYPYTMIEIQPGSMFITVCKPHNLATDILVFKYRDQRYNDENWLINSEIWELSWEQDKSQAERIVRPLTYHPNLEESKLHFRRWIESKMS